jgi:hypothetical protein
MVSKNTALQKFLPGPVRKYSYQIYFVSGSSVGFAATASDNVGVSKVEFYVDSSMMSTDTSSPYSYSWDSTTVTNGTHTIMVKAYDAAGNNASKSVSVTVNNVVNPPPPPPPPNPGTNIVPTYDTKWGQSGGFQSCSQVGPFTGGTIHCEGITVVDDPAGLNRKVAKFNVLSSYTEGGGTTNPRSQIELPAFLDNGDDYWHGMSMYFPSSFPSTISGFWTSTSPGSCNTGKCTASTTAAVSMGSFGGTFAWGARLFGSGTYAWSFQPAKGRWYDVVYHMKTAQSGGYVEFWLKNPANGQWEHQKVTNTGKGGTYGTVSADGYRWIGRTGPDTSGSPQWPLDGRLTDYYSSAMPGPLTVYYGPSRWLETTGKNITNEDALNSIDPNSY